MDSESTETTCTCHCPKWRLENRPWQYRGEGNASLVLALTQEKKIVRLSKIDNKLRRMDSDYQFISTDNNGVRTIEETRERLVFSRKIFASLLSPRFVPSCHVCHIDLQEIERIEQTLESIRPAHRKHKRLAPVCHAVVCSDCTLLPYLTNSCEPVYCIELKPKQGFLTKGHEHCPFCLNQFLKRQHGKIAVLSDYCPLDLFSGSWIRMLKALIALTRSPQNNLRIFKDGNVVFAEECQGNLHRVLKDWFCSENEDGDLDKTLPLKHFCSLVVQMLSMELFSEEIHSCSNGESAASSLDDSVPDTDQKNCSSRRLSHEYHRRQIHRPTWSQINECFRDSWSQLPRDHTQPCQRPRTVLSHSSILYKLLQVQKLGDVDFQQLYAAYDDLASRLHDRSFSYDNLRWTHPQITAEWLVNDDLHFDFIEEWNCLLRNMVRLVQRYRISSTARDCSIMIAIQRINEQEYNRSNNRFLVRDLVGRCYTFHISVVDSDPKPVSCVEKHRRRNLAMNEAFLLSTSSKSSK